MPDGPEPLTAIDARPGCEWNLGAATFTVWAPHARSVDVVIYEHDHERDSDVEHERAISMDARAGGWWQTPAVQCPAGTEYLLRLRTDDDEVLGRMDPRARAVTNSVGRCVVVDEQFEWTVVDFQPPPIQEWVIYELHPATFAGNLDAVAERLDLLVQLGVNCIELMPVAEFAGDISWGYNPALPFAVESTYGGPDALKRFVDRAHGHGIAVVLDVVYNHLGPSDLDLWRFDGWSEGDGGGIYFYNDWRASTAWGSTRPDYGRDEVRQYLIDNAMMWLADYRLDGLRLDSTVNIRNAKGEPGPDGDLEDGWRLLADLTDTVKAALPGKVLIAEDLQANPMITRPTSEGGLGFDLQWASGFVHPIRAVLESDDDRDRDVGIVAAALRASRPFARVVYTESHDEVANGRTRIPTEIDENDPGSWVAMRRTALGAVLVMTTPDVPMIFQGQEWAEEDWFDDQRPLAWERREQRPGTLQMWGDLIRFRTGENQSCGGLRGDQLAVHHIDNESGVLAFLRWGLGGPQEAVLVVCNFRGDLVSDHRVGVPAGGTWCAVFDSAWTGYHSTGSDTLTADLVSVEEPYDDQPFSLWITLDSYAAAILVRC